MPSSAAQAPVQDPFLFDSEQIDRLADPGPIRAALRLCQDKRVTALHCDGQRLWARVEDADTQEQLDLILGYDDDGNLRCECQCDRDDLDRLCVHALAALFAHGQASGAAGVLSGAFRGRLPDDLLRLADTLAGRADIEMGEDTLGYARRLAQDAARQARGQEITERIRAGGGRLPGIRSTLYPYQMDGVAFLAGRGRALLADDMGLGKTLQAIAAAHWLHQHDQVERVLIVCPASLKRQWAREIAKFTGREAQVV